ncbi:RNA guanine-N7 methyltransferase activating subunit-like [Nematolebias whitei]|uniref:RNA guanine-N7 methyltransferase activating subunit-like n=1 Tax=Nematolebias whitei TaxID=451745 RepID=UPI001896C318|nr:RNA guanine-N7 methyltransferase activating subunit-like [Nematolebias whitei]
MAETSENMKSYEDLFAHRFSSEDKEYQQYLSRPADPPPVVEDWEGRAGGNQRGRDNRYQDRRRPRGRGWGEERSWRGGHQGQQHWSDRDRRWGHGSGYQSGPPGYNSHHQRPHYDRY